MSAAPSMKPCPFCGSGEVALDEISDDLWAVCCQDCGAIGPGVEDKDGRDIGHPAIMLWNRRHDTRPDWLSEALNSGDGVYRP